MDVKRKRITRILELREILLPFQTGYNLVNAAVVCAILESISGLEPSSVITEPRYLKLVIVTIKLLSYYFNLCVGVTGVVSHELGLLGTDLHACRLWRFCQDAQLNLPVLLPLLLSHQCHQLSGGW